MPFQSFQPMPFPMPSMPIPNTPSDQINTQHTPTIAIPNSNFNGYPMVKGVVPLTYTMPFYYPPNPHPGKFSTYNPMSSYQESKRIVN